MDDVKDEFKAIVTDEEIIIDIYKDIPHHITKFKTPHNKTNNWCSFDAMRVLFNYYVEKENDRNNVRDFISLINYAVERDSYIYTTYNNKLKTEVEYVLFHKYRFMMVKLRADYSISAALLLTKIMTGEIKLLLPDKPSPLNIRTLYSEKEFFSQVKEMEVAVDCAELSDLPIPKVAVETALSTAYDTVIHIPARLYDQFKQFKKLIVYKQPSENYFGLNVKNIVAIREVTFTDNLNCSWELVDGKSRSLKVERPSYKMSGGNDSRFKNVHIGENVTIIYFHGMNPHGLKFTEVPEKIEKYCINHNYSYGFYLRGNDKDIDIEKLEIHDPGAEDEDVYDLDTELPLFKEAFESTFSTSDEIYFLGHSYGACFAKYFAKEYGCKSISLDGSNLYTSVPHFIGLYLDEEVKAEDIEWNEKSYVYKGINYYGNDDAGLQSHYCDVIWQCREDIPNNTIIDYTANPDAPEEVKIIKVDNKYYSNYYELHYGEEYRHTLHMIPEVVSVIFETFIDTIPTADKVSSNYFKRGKRLYGGEDENDILIIDVDIPNREWKGFDVIKVNANDKSTYEEHISKRGFMWKPFFCKFENYDKYNKLGFNNILTFLFTDKDTDIDDEPAHRSITIIEATDTTDVVNIYGKNARQYFRTSDPYEFVIKRFFDIYDNKLLVGPSQCLHKFYIDRMLNDEYHVLDDCLKYYCKDRKIMLTSDDVKCLGVGSFNVALRVNDDVLRIHINYETPFDYEGAEILMKEKDTGFVPVKEVHDGCTIVAACETIKDVDNDKAKAMCDKLRKFFAKYKDLGYVDYHWGNIMEYKGKYPRSDTNDSEYVITDIDLNMVSPKYFLSYPKVKLDDVLNTEQSTGWNPKLYVTLLEAYAIPVTTYNLTMVALNVFEAVDYNRLFTLTKELADTVMSMETYDNFRHDEDD